MRRYTAAEARTRLSDALDHAEAGSAVVIERRGVRFELVRVRDRSRRRTPAPLIQILDPAVERVRDHGVGALTQALETYARRPLTLTLSPVNAVLPHGVPYC